MRMVLACVIVVISSPVFAAPIDPITALDDPAAAKAMISDGATCVPRSEKLQLQLGLVDEAPVLCAVSNADNAKVLGTIACWDVDVARKQLVARAPRLLPGQLVPTKLIKGCTHGLCLPATEKPSADAYVAVGIEDTGERAVVVAGDIAYVFDRPKWAFTGKHVLENGVSPDLFVGRNLLGIAASGPAENVQVSSIERPRKDPNPGGKASVDLYLGSMSLVRTGQVLLVKAGPGNVMSYDVARDAVTSIRKIKLSKSVAACTLAMDTHAACKGKVFNTSVEPYSAAAFVSHKDGFLARLSGSRAGELVVLDKQFREKPKTKFASLCAKK